MPASRPLPWFKGPKLGPFGFRDETNRDIKFLEHLGGGAHAEVFRAVIDGSEYAIKLVCFSPAGTFLKILLNQSSSFAFCIPASWSLRIS